MDRPNQWIWTRQEDGTLVSTPNFEFTERDEDERTLREAVDDHVCDEEGCQEEGEHPDS